MYTSIRKASPSRLHMCIFLVTVTTRRRRQLPATATTSVMMLKLSVLWRKSTILDHQTVNERPTPFGYHSSQLEVSNEPIGTFVPRQIKNCHLNHILRHKGSPQILPPIFSCIVDVMMTSLVIIWFGFFLALANCYESVKGEYRIDIYQKVIPISRTGLFRVTYLLRKIFQRIQQEFKRFLQVHIPPQHKFSAEHTEQKKLEIVFNLF